MPNVIAIKDGVVVQKIFSIDADHVVLSDLANIGDNYNPDTGVFSPPSPPPPAETI